MDLDQSRSQREECALTQPPLKIAACSSTCATAGPSPCAPFPWQNFCIRSLSYCDRSFHLSISNFKASVSFLPLLLSLTVTLACGLLFPLTAVCTNGWLSIFLTAWDPRCIFLAGITKTLSWPLTRKETARNFHPAHEIPLIAFIFHVIIVQVPRHSILRAANARPAFPFLGCSDLLSLCPITRLTASVAHHPSQQASAYRSRRKPNFPRCSPFPTTCRSHPSTTNTTRCHVLADPMNFSSKRLVVLAPLFYTLKPARNAVSRIYRSRSHTHTLSFGILLMIIKGEPQSRPKDEA